LFVPVKLWEGSSQLFPFLPDDKFLRVFGGRELKVLEGSHLDTVHAFAAAYFRCRPRYHGFMCV
jgi:hypothetical protein